MANIKTDSIDSEIEEILNSLCQYVHSVASASKHYGIFIGGEPMNEAMQAIHAKYVSRKEIEEALGEDENVEFGTKVDFSNLSNDALMVRKIRNNFRQTLRAKLLPLTKGDSND